MTPAGEVANAVRGGVTSHLLVSKTHRGRGSTSVDRWVLGDRVWLMNVRYHGLAVSCPRSRRSDPDTRVLTVAVLEPGDWTLIRGGLRIDQRPDRPTLVALDQSAAFDFRGHGHGSAIAVHITHARLTISIETVRRGLDNLHRGLPLYALALDHLRELGRLADVNPDLLATLNMSTVGIIRSLLISAAEGARSVSATGDLISRIERHIENHLGQSDLGADTIATAHNISVRQLYKTWPQSHGNLAGYIATRRLAQARSSLLTHQHLSIAAIAQKHGFTHPTHFTQLFRATYGVTPSGWRRCNQSLSRQR